MIRDDRPPLSLFPVLRGEGGGEGRTARRAGYCSRSNDAPSTESNVTQPPAHLAPLPSPLPRSTVGEGGSGATLNRVKRRRSVFADRLLDFRDFTFSDGAEFLRRGAWREFFASRIGGAFDGRVIFEIGCNDGALLGRVAARYPTTAFIGIDWKCRALHTAAERVAGAGLSNVALLHGRAQDIPRFFAGGELDEIWLFHPDPCDKPNELRNRLFAELFLLDAHRVLRDGGSLVLKTDHPDYYQAALEVSGAVADQFNVPVASSDFWNDEGAQRATANRCFATESTFFETRYRKKRQPIHYLELTKHV